MPACSFCKKHYKEPRGLSIFTFDGRTVYFCSSKCRRNADLKRDPKKVRWVKRKTPESEESSETKEKNNKEE